jgi:hypothetical protein
MSWDMQVCPGPYRSFLLLYQRRSLAGPFNWRKTSEFGKNHKMHISREIENLSLQEKDQQMKSTDNVVFTRTGLRIGMRLLSPRTTPRGVPRGIVVKPLASGQRVPWEWSQLPISNISGLRADQKRDLFSIQDPN